MNFISKMELDSILMYDYLFFHAKVMKPPLTEREMTLLCSWVGEITKYAYLAQELHHEEIVPQQDFLTNLWLKLNKQENPGDFERARDHFICNALLIATGLQADGGKLRADFRQKQEELFGVSPAEDFDGHGIHKRVDNVMIALFSPFLYKGGRGILRWNGQTLAWLAHKAMGRFTQESLYLGLRRYPGAKKVHKMLLAWGLAHKIKWASKLSTPALAQRFLQWVAKFRAVRAVQASTRFAWLTSLPKRVIENMVGSAGARYVMALRSKILAEGAFLTRGRTASWAKSRSFNPPPLFLFLTGYFAARGVGARIDFEVNKVGFFPCHFVAESWDFTKWRFQDDNNKGIAQAALDDNLQTLENWMTLADHASANIRFQFEEMKKRIPPEFSQALNLEQFREALNINEEKKVEKSRHNPPSGEAGMAGDLSGDGEWAKLAAMAEDPSGAGEFGDPAAMAEDPSGAGKTTGPAATSGIPPAAGKLPAQTAKKKANTANRLAVGLEPDRTRVTSWFRGQDGVHSATCLFDGALVVASWSDGYYYPALLRRNPRDGSWSLDWHYYAEKDPKNPKRRFTDLGGHQIMGFGLLVPKGPEVRSSATRKKLGKFAGYGIVEGRVQVEAGGQNYSLGRICFDFGNGEQVKEEIYRARKNNLSREERIEYGLAPSPTARTGFRTQDGNSGRDLLFSGCRVFIPYGPAGVYYPAVLKNRSGFWHAYWTQGGTEVQGLATCEVVSFSRMVQLGADVLSYEGNDKPGKPLGRLEDWYPDRDAAGNPILVLMATAGNYAIEKICLKK